jgi:Mce-associated membrane protein
MMAPRPTHDTALTDAAALAEQAEAEAAEAEAQAAAARARLEQLRAQHAADDEAADGPTEGVPDAGVDEGVTDFPDEDADAAAATDLDDPRPRRRLRLPRGRTVGVTVGVLLLCALLSASGFMFWQNHRESERQAQEAQFNAAARQGVINLMSLDFNKGDQDLQRLIDSTTGQFREDFEKSRGDFMSVMKESKVVTSAEVKATGIDSMTNDSAVVLVAATSKVSNSASAKQTPRAWRLAVSLQRDNGQLKMSKVEFVP